ncbi:MAG: hypothetical protein AB2809_16055, partial [Candidatus Thiodiazotropha sp.]
MKLASIRIKSSGKQTIAVVLDGVYLDLHQASNGDLPDSMIAFLEQGAVAMTAARSIAQEGGSAQ